VVGEINVSRFHGFKVSSFRVSIRRCQCVGLCIFALKLWNYETLELFLAHLPRQITHRLAQYGNHSLECAFGA
jgi:hypothetical protein